MFGSAIISLVVALLAAVVIFGGWVDATAAATVWHVYLIAIGLFFVFAMVVVLDLALPHDVHALWARGVRGGPARRADPDTWRKRAM
jgi:hypothetical protein